VSHVVSIQTRVYDPATLAVACARLNLPPPAAGRAHLFSGEAAGLLVQLPGWQYPVVIDTADGTVRFDNFEGAWGDPQHLRRLLQVYAVEKAKLEARKKGYAVTEQALEDGSIKLQIVEGA
jgi:hypothetical protein